MTQAVCLTVCQPVCLPVEQDWCSRENRAKRRDSDASFGEEKTGGQVGQTDRQTGRSDTQTDRQICRLKRSPVIGSFVVIWSLDFVDGGLFRPVWLCHINVRIDCLWRLYKLYYIIYTYTHTLTL